MKNRLMKIWGVVLVVVVLAGLLVPVMPASAAILDMTWSAQGAPAAVPFNVLAPAAGGNVWLWDVAPDGKTMFAVNNASTTVVGVNAVGAATLNVASTNGFPTSGSVYITSQATAVAYTGVTATSFTGIPATAITAATVGGEVTTPGAPIYKSADGGLTFSTTGLGTGLANIGPYVDIAVSNDYANDASVALINATTVYRSVNGGAVWGALPAVIGAGNAIPGGTALTSIAIGAHYAGGQAILVGATSAGAAGTGGAARLTTTTLTWTNLGFMGAAIVATPVDVLGIAFSPNHRNDAEVLAVTQPAAGAVYLETKIGTNAANADISKATVAALGATAIPASVANKAELAFPADYDWAANNRTFVGIGLVGINVAAAANMDVYRVSGALGVGASLVSRLTVTGQVPAAASNISSVSFKGNLADGWLYVGIANTPGPVVWRATSAGGSVVSFIPAAKSPTGTYNTIVSASKVAADTSIWAITSGLGSALSLSTDGGSTFNQISLINISAAANFRFLDLDVIDANTQYLLAFDDKDASGAAAFTAGDTTTIFKTTNGGINWQGVWVRTSAAAEGMNAVYPSPAYATDNTIYVTQNDSRIWKSSNAGGTFTGYSTPNSVAIAAFAVVDANTYYVGSANAIYKSGSFVPGTIGGENPVSIAYVSATDMFVGTAGGSVYRSTNGGTSFLPVGTPFTVGANVRVLPDTAYATNKTIYGGSATGVNRFVIDTSTSWTLLRAGNIVSLSQVPDGTLYASDTNIAASQVSAAQIQRCTTPTAVVTTWDTMIPYPDNDGAGPNVALTGLLGFTTVANAATGTIGAISAVPTGTAQVPNNTLNVLISMAAGPAGATPAGPYIYGVKDTVVAAPAITAPAANAQVATNQTFTWVPVTTGVPVRYDFQIGYDVAFTNLITNNAAQVGTVFVPAAALLNPGTTYYWRVRVANTSPMASKWSASTKFSVLLAQSGNSLVGAGGTQIYPAAGATNIPAKPVFQWASVNGAVSYDLQVADNPVFVNPLDNQTGLNTTVWTETKTLDYGKTYYWRVRAVSASGVASDWVAQAFTVMPAPATGPAATGPAATAPVVVPTVTVNIPAQPQPTFTVNVPAQTTGAPQTPASIWVLIAIGAILIIAVIVLIARTRRV